MERGNEQNNQKYYLWRNELSRRGLNPWLDILTGVAWSNSRVLFEEARGLECLLWWEVCGLNLDDWGSAKPILQDFTRGLSIAEVSANATSCSFGVDGALHGLAFDLCVGARCLKYRFFRMALWASEDRWSSFRKAVKLTLHLDLANITA